MKKITKRVLSVFMAAIMMLSVLSVGAFAATKDNVKHYNTYTSLGDSIAAGFSMPDYKKQAAGRYVLGKARVEGAYPDLLAKAVEADKLNQLASPGYRTNELRFLLDNDYDGDFVTQKWVAVLSHLPENTYDGLKASRPEYQNAIKESDLVTVDIGLNDTWLPVMGAIQEVLYRGDPNNAVVESSDGAMVNTNTSSTWIEDLQIIAQSPIYLPKFIEALAKIATLSDYTKNMTVIVEKIHELNPNATVVLLSNYNPFRDWPESWAGPLSDAAEKVLYNKMNQTKKDLAAKYDNYYYVDVNDLPPVRHDSFEKVMATGSFGNWDPHPTEAGHQYITDQIIKALPEQK